MLQALSRYAPLSVRHNGESPSRPSSPRLLFVSRAVTSGMGTAGPKALLVVGRQALFFATSPVVRTRRPLPVVIGLVHIEAVLSHALVPPVSDKLRSRPQAGRPRFERAVFIMADATARTAVHWRRPVSTSSTSAAMKRQVTVSHSPRKRILIHPERNSQPRDALVARTTFLARLLYNLANSVTGISFDEGTRLAGFTVKGWRASPSKATLLPGERVGRTLSACDDGQLGALTAGGLPTSAVRPVFVVAQRAPGCRLSRDAVASDNRVCRTHVPLKGNQHKDDLERSSLCRQCFFTSPVIAPSPLS